MYANGATASSWRLLKILTSASSRFDFPLPLPPTKTVWGNSDVMSKSTSKLVRFLKERICSRDSLMMSPPRTWLDRASQNPSRERDSPGDRGLRRHRTSLRLPPHLRGIQQP